MSLPKSLPRLVATDLDGTLVRSDGSVGDVRVLQGLGGGLESRAIAAVRQWKFAPAMRRGQPVDVLVEVAVEFTLR